MAATVTGAYVGASGWSYPSWRPEFYPAGADAKSFLGEYARQLRTVELNTTGYRLPAEDQFQRWAGQVPDGFRFAPKLPGSRVQSAGEFSRRALALGDRLGPVRVQLVSPRDEGVIELLLGSVDPRLRLAFDLPHPSWDGIEARLAEAGAVRVGDHDADAPFRYLRFRDPPYAEEELVEAAARIAPLLAAGVEVYAYFRHEDEPTAPRFALRLLELLSTASA